MVRLSPQGVCYEIEDTPYRFEWRGITYCFSSNPHKNKFKREVRKRELWLNDSLSRRFGMAFHVEVVADVQLYQQIETRGFYLLTNDGAEYRDASQMIVMPNMLVLGVVEDDIDLMWGVDNG